MSDKKYTTKMQRELLESVGVPHQKGRTWDEAQQLLQGFIDRGQLRRNILDPPTPKQLAFIERHNIAAPPDVTKEEATALIGEKIAELDKVTPISEGQYDFIERLDRKPEWDMTRHQAGLFIEHLYAHGSTCNLCGQSASSRSRRCEHCGGFLPRRSAMRPPGHIYQARGFWAMLLELLGL